MLADFRTAIQELVTPDLKALQEKVAGLEKTIDGRLSAFTSTIDAQNTVLAANKGELLAKIDQLLNLVKTNHDSVMQSMNLEKRITALEAGQSAPMAVQGYVTGRPRPAGAWQAVEAEVVEVQPELAAYPEEEHS
jgi:hypothetical protein